MNYLILILGGIIGFLIYLLYKKENTKDCHYCGEIIKEKAIFCKHCGKDLVAKVKVTKELTPMELIKKITPIEVDIKVTSTQNPGKTIEQFKEELIENNLNKITTQAFLTYNKKMLEAQIFVLQKVQVLTKDKSNKQK